MDFGIHFFHRKVAVPVRKASSHWKITVFSKNEHFFGILACDSVKCGILRFREIRGYPYVPWSKCGFRFNFDFSDLWKKRDFLDPTKIEYSKTTYFTVLRKTRWQMIGQKTAKNAFLDDFTKSGILACETEENLINVNRFRTWNLLCFFVFFYLPEVETPKYALSKTQEQK